MQFMKYSFALTAFFVAATTFAQVTPLTVESTTKVQNKPFTNEKDSASYAAGLNEGERIFTMMMQAGADTIITMDLFIDGMVDFMKNNPRLSQESAQAVLQSYFGRYQAELDKKSAAQEEAYQKMYEANKEKYANFLAENKKQKGVITTASGLQYKIVEKGKGNKIKFGDHLKVHYALSTTDGVMIESSREEGAEAFEFDFSNSGMIPGWIEVLQLMKKGSKYTVYVPYDLGYGEQGNPPKIEPYATLVFDIEIVDVTPAK